MDGSEPDARSQLQARINQLMEDIMGPGVEKLAEHNRKINIQAEKNRAEFRKRYGHLFPLTSNQFRDLS